MERLARMPQATVFYILSSMRALERGGATLTRDERSIRTRVLTELTGNVGHGFRFNATARRTSGVIRRSIAMWRDWWRRCGGDERLEWLIRIEGDEPGRSGAHTESEPATAQRVMRIDREREFRIGLFQDAAIKAPSRYVNPAMRLLRFDEPSEDDIKWAQDLARQWATFLEEHPFPNAPIRIGGTWMTGNPLDAPWESGPPAFPTIEPDDASSEPAPEKAADSDDE
jgi:hypothetical protein